MLRWRLRISLALTRRLARLRDQLPIHRPFEEDSTLLWAAVAAVLVPDPDAILLIRRAERHGDPWSGHMALPGGRRQGEEDLLATAIRETNEEVGISLGQDTLAGALEDVVPRTPMLPPIAVRPFVFLLPNRPPVMRNPEVASARWVPLDALLSPDAYSLIRLDHVGGGRDVPAYRVEEDIIWGMTERILTALSRHLELPE